MLKARTIRNTMAMIGLLCGGSSCRVIHPYEKEYLLNPVMDDARVERLSAPYSQAMRPNERLASAAASTGSSSCPTCGGH